MHYYLDSLNYFGQYELVLISSATVGPTLEACRIANKEHVHHNDIE